MALNTFGDIMREKANRQLARQNSDIQNSKRKVDIEQGQLNLAKRVQTESMADRSVERDWKSGEADKTRDYTTLESLRDRNFQEKQSGVERNWKSDEGKTLRGWQSSEAIEARNSTAIEAAKERLARSSESDKRIGALNQEAELGRAHDVKLARVRGAIDQGTAEISANNAQEVLKKTLEFKQQDGNADRYSKYIEGVSPDSGEIDPYDAALKYQQMQKLGAMSPEQIQQAQQENEINTTREAISTMTERQRKRYLKGLSPDMLEKLGITPQQ